MMEKERGRGTDGRTGGGGDQLRVNGVVMADHSNATLFLFGPSHSTIGAQGFPPPPLPFASNATTLFEIMFSPLIPSHSYLLILFFSFNFLRL